MVEYNLAEKQKEETTTNYHNHCYHGPYLTKMTHSLSSATLRCWQRIYHTVFKHAICVLLIQFLSQFQAATAASVRYSLDDFVHLRTPSNQLLSSFDKHRKLHGKERLLRRDNNYDHTICQSLDQAECKNITTLTSIQTISQRDVQLNLTMLDVTYLGFDLNSALFKPNGYIQQTVDLVPQVLFLGFTFLQLDVYWNEESLQWQLCPYDVDQAVSQASKDPGIVVENGAVTVNNVTCSISPLIGFHDIINEMERYISATASDLTTSLIQLSLRLHSLNTQSVTSSSLPVKMPHVPDTERLSYIVDSNVKSRLYTPGDLSQDRAESLTYGVNGIFSDVVSGFLKVYQFLLVDSKRLIVNFSNISMLPPDMTTYPASYLNKDYTYFFETVYEVSVIDTTPKTNYSSYYNPYLTLDVVNTDQFSPPNCTNQTISDFRNNLKAGHGNLSQSMVDQMCLSDPMFNVAVRDTLENPFDTQSIQQYIECGFLPILSSPVNDLNFLVSLANEAVWSWTYDQPSIPDSVPNINDSDDGAGLGAHGSFENILKSNAQIESNGSQVVDTNLRSAWRCAVLDEEGWRAANCFDNYPVLCAPQEAAPELIGHPLQEGDNNEEREILSEIYSWSFGTNTSYFGAPGACPNSDVFSIPRTSLQDTSVRLSLKANGSIPFPLWIDINSIDVKDCWVSGGPYARCPYTTSSWTQGKIVPISVVSAVTFILLIVVFLISLDKIPVRHSEGKFKKIIAMFEQNQYQGVPS